MTAKNICKKIEVMYEVVKRISIKESILQKKLNILDSLKLRAEDKIEHYSKLCEHPDKKETKNPESMIAYCPDCKRYVDLRTGASFLLG